MNKEPEYCFDKANGLVSCDGCTDKNCPLLKRKEEKEC